MWIDRYFSSRVQEVAGYFPALLLTGPRQVGKTALLRRLFPEAGYVTLNLSHFNRLRLQIGQDTPVDGEPAWTASLQWTVILGNHTHSLDW